eukprot:4601917-Amphidinium_carterae.1
MLDHRPQPQVEAGEEVEEEECHVDDDGNEYEEAQVEQPFQEEPPPILLKCLLLRRPLLLSMTSLAPDQPLCGASPCLRP